MSEYLKNLFKSKKEPSKQPEKKVAKQPEKKVAKQSKKKASNQPEVGLLPVGTYKMPFRLKASGILFPDGTIQTTAAGGSGGGSNSTDEIEAIKKEQVTQNTDIAKNEGDITAIKAEQKTQDGKISANESAITAIQGEQTAQDGKISANKSDITAIKVEQTTQDGKISANEGDITTIKAEQKTQDGKISANEGDITAIKAEQKVQDGKILANENAIKANAEKIADNKKAIEANKGSIEANAQDIIELEEEIEAIAPSFDRGSWNADLTTQHPRPPLEGQIYFGDGLQKITDYADVKEIFIHNKDASSTRQNHTWGDVEVGQMIEFFDEKDSDFLLAKITEVQTQTDYAYIKVDVLKYEGGHDENPLRMKIFTIAETEVDLSSFPTLGGDNEFNGKQEFNKNVTFKGVETTIQPQLSSRWHKFNVTPPKNENGTNNTSEAYGVDFYLDSGNTWKNQFKISNRNGVAFSVRGGEDLNGQLHSNWKYSGPQSEDNNIATVKYVTDAVEGIDIPEVDLTGYELHTLASSDNMSYKSPTSLNNYDFATDRNGANSITKVYLYKLKNNTNNMVYVSDYEPTPSTVFTIYYPSSGEIVFSTLVKNWQTSSYSTYQIMFDTPNYGNFYKLGYSLTSSSNYRLMLTNLRKK